MLFKLLNIPSNKTLYIKEFYFDTGFRKFVREHENANITDLLLQDVKDIPFPLKDAADQIKLSKKARLKIPEWGNNEEVYHRDHR